MAMNFMDCKHIRETKGLPKFQKEPLAKLTIDIDMQPNPDGKISVHARTEPYEPLSKPTSPPQPTPMDLLRKELENPPCYLPKPDDNIPSKDTFNTEMGPIGPWATGKVDWSPVAGLTGIRPVVTSYTITRFSPFEWRAKNLAAIKEAAQTFGNAAKNAKQAITVAEQMKRNVRNMQEQSNKDINSRVRLIQSWKDRLELAMQNMANEITTMEEERIRLKKSLVMFGIPESIARECISMRAGRADTELIRDEPEMELVNELALIAEIRRLLTVTLEEFEQQQIENRVARERLESDWSDKKQALEMDQINVTLNNHSPTIMWRPGAMRQPPEQASGKYWDHFSQEIFEECEATRNKSIKLRSNLTELLTNAVVDLKSQAQVVLEAFRRRIKCIHDNIDRLESELKNCLNTLADTENRIEYIKETIRSFDASMKVAQSRMYNRSFRPNVENCRDKAQQNLIDEVAMNLSSVTAITTQLDNTEKVKTKLMTLRNTLEREIMLNRRTLFIDEDRCLRLRSHFPNLSAEM